MIKHIGLSGINVLSVQKKILLPLIFHKQGIDACNIKKGQHAPEILIDNMFDPRAVFIVFAVNGNQHLFPDASLIRFKNKPQDIMVFSLLDVEC